MTALSPTLTALLRGILTDPADITARLVYADALDEDDQHEWAELIRVQVELVALPILESDYPACRSCDGDGLSDPPPYHRTCRQCDGTGKADHKRYLRVKHLLARQSALLRLMGTNGFFSELPGAYRTTDASRSQITTADGITYDIANGFVSRVSLSTRLFLTHATTLFASHPITSVTLTGKKPNEAIGDWGVYWNFDRTVLGESRQHDIPRELWGYINLPFIRGTDTMKATTTNQLALSALSLACVNYGRSLASLPPLNGNAPAV